MSQQEEIVLWIDQRWKSAIEKHLKDETLQEHLENVLDELCNQLPEREYERISRAIQSEAAAQRAEGEAARTYAAYHVTERGKDWYFKTSPGEELLTVGKKLRSYITSEKVTMPDLFIKMFAGGRPITAEEYNALTAVRMENTGKVCGVFDVNFDKREFSAVHIMDGWQTWAMRDVSVASYHATRSYFASADEQWRKLLNHLNGKEITSAGHLSARNFTFGEEIIESDGKLNFYLQADFDVDAAFGTFADKPEVDYSQKEQKHPITKAVLAPMKAVKKMLVSMELHLDASIDKLDNLAMNVQIDKEKHTENEKKQEQTEPEMAEAKRVEAEIVYSPMVAEPQEYQYNADAFEARGVDDVKQEAAHNDVSKVREDKAR